MKSKKEVNKFMIDNLTDLINPDISLNGSSLSDEDLETKIDELSIKSKNKSIISDYILARDKKKDISNKLEPKEIKIKDITVNTKDFYSWFKEFGNLFENFSELEIKINGVRPEELICVSMQTHSGIIVNGYPQQRVEVIKNPDIYSVLDLKPIDLNFLTNGLFETTQHIEGIHHINSYACKSSLTNFYSILHEESIIPILELPKMKKSSDNYMFFIFDEELPIDDILIKPPDINMISSNYPPFKKIENDFKTN